MANKFIKDQNAVLDYEWDWSSWLADGETISSYTVSVPDGITKDDDDLAGDSVTVWLSGGTLGVEYMVVCQIVTSAGRTDERSIKIIVSNR